MKNSESLRRLLQAMNGFNAAYCYLLSEIKQYEHETKSSVNDIPGFTESYPFDKSFDEIQVDNWLNAVVDNARKSAFKVLHYDYLNTGGNTMVGIFTVWLPRRNQTVYVLANEEGCALSTVDYISNDVEIDDYDEVMIDNVNWERMTGNEDFFELYRYCLNEYTKSDCRYFGCTRAIPYRLLSDKLKSDVSAEYLAWCEENNQGCIPTDGIAIFESDDYIPPARDWDGMLRNIKDFQDWHSKTAGNPELYPHDYIITLANRTIRIPYGADAFSHIDELLKNVIEDW